MCYFNFIWFSFSFEAGEISVKSSLDYETLRTQNKLTFDVTITTNDGRENSISKQITFLVTDVNEQQTGFVKSLYTIETGEGQVKKYLLFHENVKKSKCKQKGKNAENYRFFSEVGECLGQSICWYTSSGTRFLWFSNLHIGLWSQPGEIPHGFKYRWFSWISYSIIFPSIKPNWS